MQIGRLDEEKPFLDHLDELRSTIMRMAIVLLITTILSFLYAPELMKIMRYPVDQVWTLHEESHLVPNISSDEWGEAKSLAYTLPGLSEKAKGMALMSIPEKQRELVECAQILRTARQLKEDVRPAFIQHAASTESVAKLAQSLEDEEAVLTEDSGRGALKLMGAFQPSEAFMLSMKLSFYAGIIIASPLLLYLLLQFIVPGLLQHERKLLYKCMFYGFGLFLVGVFFAYWIVLPRVLTFFYEYSLSFGIANEWRIGYYINFATRLVLLFGLAFELPVIVFPFVKLGVLSYELMSSTRRYAIVGVCVLAAVITPTPDIVTMMFMAVPMYALYELCIFLAWREDKRRRAEELESQRAAEEAYGLHLDDGEDA